MLTGSFTEIFFLLESPGRCLNADQQIKLLKKSTILYGAVQYTYISAVSNRTKSSKEV
jgi:hypothetical protein